MSYHHLSSSPSSLFRSRHFLSSNSDIHTFKLIGFPPLQSTIYLQTTHVSLRETRSSNAPKDENPQRPDEISESPSKRYVWINPKSNRASQLKKNSYDSRYASLMKVAESLSSAILNESEVLDALKEGLGDKILEIDAHVVLNNMVNPQNALLALKYFQQRIKLKKEVNLYNVTLKVLRKCKDLERAERLFDEIVERGIKPDNVTFSTMISCARMCCLPEKAVEWFEKMPSFGCHPDEVTYSAMIDAYGRAGNFDKAFSLYDRARAEKWRVGPVTFSTLIKIHGQSGNYDGCLNVYEEMKALGAEPNLVSFNTLLDAMARAKRPWQAKKIYQEMTSKGFSPNWITYVSLLRAFGRARYADDAFKVYREMKGKGMELNVILYNFLLSMCADVGYTDQAVEIFKEMKSSETLKPDSWTFSSMITIYSYSGKVLEAEATLNEMVESGFQPDIFILTPLIRCYGRAKLTDDVVRTFDQMLERGITPDERLCVCLLNVMTETPQDELSKLTDCIERANEKLGRVVRLLVERQGSSEYFRKEASELFHSVCSDVKKTYCNDLIDLCVLLDLLERACELLDMGLKLEIYTTLQSRSPTQWSLYLKGLSIGTALTALHFWFKDLSRSIEAGEELPPLLRISTGQGKYKHSVKGLASVLKLHLKELNSPFHESPDKVGWFLTTKVAVKSWLESRSSSELVDA